MSLDELEADFRERQQASGGRLVILALQVREDDVRGLRPLLEDRQMSLSELVRELLLDVRPLPVPMMEVR